MPTYKGRVPTDNIIDIRTGRGSPDDRDVQNQAKMNHEDEAILSMFKSIASQMNGPPMPRPDPRTKMPGGELALGKGQSRGEFWQQNAEQVWVKHAANALINRHYTDKFWGIFPQSKAESAAWAIPKSGTEENAQFLLDTFKRARSVGYPIHPINEQPAPLPMKFKVSQ